MTESRRLSMPGAARPVSVWMRLAGAIGEVRDDEDRRVAGGRHYVEPARSQNGLA